MDTADGFHSFPIEIASGIYWLGYAADNLGLHCNPYLILEGDEAILIDGGSRDDFSNVMLKILRTGIKPSQITRLIYHHYDPDLCGSLPQLEAIINTTELRIISHMENNVFIHYYSKKTPKLDYRTLNSEFVFQTGRRLTFHATPFCHSPGSFMTYDKQTKTLFSSDLFGSYDARWTLYLELVGLCDNCKRLKICPETGKKCPLYGIEQFHERIMTSNLALHRALDVIESLEIDHIAPQHGSIIRSREDAQRVIQHLRQIENVGVDYLVAEKQL